MLRTVLNFIAARSNATRQQSEKPLKAMQNQTYGKACLVGRDLAGFGLRTGAGLGVFALAPCSIRGGVLV